MDQIKAQAGDSRDVRVRIAPSPTGRLHIGNLRAALFNWLFARHNGGTFVVRIEDTDRERSKQEYVDSILDAFSWVGMASDEPIVFQSQRTEIYNEQIQKLLDSGDAYWSDPLTEENGISVVRFHVPRDQAGVTFVDAIRGPITVSIDQIDDFVIARSDGSPLYNFVVVVDDLLMGMTHVIRGEDHISNTPKQVLLYQALGAKALPQFAHLPLILGDSGAPLSKRDAATAVLDYKEQGYLPQALCNYLVRLGWSHGDQEIFTQREMINLFDITDVQKAGAVFDLVKLRWMNGIYIRQETAESLLAYLNDILHVDVYAACPSWSHRQVRQLATLYQDRVLTLRELEAAIVRLYKGPAKIVVQEGFVEGSGKLLDVFLFEFNLLDEITKDLVEALIRKICADADVGLAALAKPLRYALTGSLESPSIFSLLEILGRDLVVERVAALRGVLS